MESLGLSKLDEILEGQHGEEALITVLRKVQTEYGYIPPEAIALIAKALKVAQSRVYSVATFYSFLSTKPQGRNVIRICKSLPCLLKNSGAIIESVEKEIGIKPGETTPDGRFSFKLTNCIGACDRAPALMINNDVHVDLTPGEISQVLKGYK